MTRKATTHSPGSVTDKVKDAALQAGFDAVAIAPAVTLDHQWERYREWLNSQYHGSMQYMERNVEKRRQINELLDGVKSVVVLARNYYTDYRHEDNAAMGKISRYAWGDDYHDVIPPALDKIIDCIRSLDTTAMCRRFTDTAPILEKQWAVISGLGWQGKHSNIIRKQSGSWFFIGIILTTLELEPDEPVMDYCGKCTACIDACPTGAIVEPYVVDAQKCISYWTIEVKPEIPIPQQIASSMDNWLFGCDICQDVCPWNRFARPTEESAFQPRGGETSISLESIVNLPPESYATRFRKSPLKRPKHAGIHRNAITLINSHNSNKKNA